MSRIATQFHASEKLLLITKVEMKIILYNINNEVRLSRLCLVTELSKPKNALVSSS